MTTKQISLRRQLGLLSLYTLAVGTIIGVGWITVMGNWLLQAGSLGAMLAFLGGGLVMIVIGLCYAEVAGMYPVAGGEVAYVYEMYGTKTAFVAGWILAFDYIAVTTFEAISVGWVTAAIWPVTRGPAVYDLFGQDVYLGSLSIGLVVMAIITWINYRGAKSTAIFQNAMTVVLLIVAVGFICVGIYGGEAQNLRPYVGTTGSNWTVGVLAVLATTPFWYAGFDTIPQAMGEVSERARLNLLPRVIVLAIGSALVFYCLVILAASMSLPRNELLEMELPVAGALVAAFGSPVMGKIVLFAGLCGLITSWNAIFFAATRLVFALSRAQMISSKLAQVHSRYASPHSAVLLVGVLGAIGTFFGRNAIATIANAGSTCLSVVFLLVVVGLVRLRSKRPEKRRPYKVPGGALLPGLAAVFSACMIGLSIYVPYRDAAGRLPNEWIILLVWCFLGVAFWILEAKNRESVTERDRRCLLLEESEL